MAKNNIWLHGRLNEQNERKDSKNFTSVTFLDETDSMFNRMKNNMAFQFKFKLQNYVKYIFQYFVIFLKGKKYF